MKAIHVDEDGYEHVCQFQVGDWVAFEFPQGPPKPGKVEELRYSDEDGWCAKVRFRFSNGEKSLWLNRGIRKMRWRKTRGRNLVELI